MSGGSSWDERSVHGIPVEVFGCIGMRVAGVLAIRVGYEGEGGPPPQGNSFLSQEVAR